MSDGMAAWQRVYSRRGLHYGGTGDVKLVEPYLKNGMIVLDAGCGDGKSASLLARKSEVIGADFSREALLSLRSQRDPERRVNLVVCNILSMPFGSEKFDVTVCVHTLSHMLAQERERAADEIRRVTKKGGYILLEGFGREDIRFGRGKEVEESTFLRGDGVVTHYFRKDEMAALFPDLAVSKELRSAQRVSFGTVSGKRDLRRVLLRKA